MRSCTPAPDLYRSIQTDIIRQFKERGVTAYTGMESHINFGQFTRKLDKSNHIKAAYREEATKWLTQMLTLTYVSQVQQIPEKEKAKRNTKEEKTAKRARTTDALVVDHGTNDVKRTEAIWPCRTTVTKKNLLLLIREN